MPLIKKMSSKDISTGHVLLDNNIQMALIYYKTRTLICQAFTLEHQRLTCVSSQRASYQSKKTKSLGGRGIPTPHRLTFLWISSLSWHHLISLPNKETTSSTEMLSTANRSFTQAVFLSLVKQS